MVEAVAVLPLVVILFAATSYFATVYGARIETSADVRAAAWANALNGCNATGAQVQSEPSTLDVLDGEGVDPPRELTGLGTAAGGQSLVSQGRRTRAVRSRPIRRSVGLGWAAGTITTSFQIPCDERPTAGNSTGALRYGWRTIRFW